MKKTEKNASYDVVVIGGGLAGLFAAVSAARHGAKTVIVQDRPMFGGNASSEIRMWICGAAGKNRKETGLLEELQLDNIYFNPLLKYTQWDGVMYSFAASEPNLEILLNTTVEDCNVTDGHIDEVSAWNLHSYTLWHLKGRLFIDCSGDGIMRLSGAAARRGHEGRSEFHESLAPEEPNKLTKGNSIIMQLRRTELPHRPFIPPAWAYKFDDSNVPSRPLLPDGNNFWWLEFGGELDSLNDADSIRETLLKIAYGVWAYIKNHPDGRGIGWELDWIGSLPGRRESWRFEGDHILSQTEIEEGGNFDDVIAHGGWSLGEHHPRAFFNKDAPSFYYEAPSPYGIPYRSLYSRNIDNLLFAGRQISESHIAQNSTRVMGTTSVLGQAAGTAAALAIRYDVTPRELGQLHIRELQKILLDDDQFLPGIRRTPSALTMQGEISHEVLRDGMDRDWDDGEHAVTLAPGETCSLKFAQAQMLSGIRLVFDSDLSDPKRQRKTEGEEYKELPPMLTRAFRIEVLDEAGKWSIVAQERENHHRLVRLHWEKRPVRELRFTLLETWGKASGRIFSLDALDDETSLPVPGL